MKRFIAISLGMAAINFLIAAVITHFIFKKKEMPAKRKFIIQMIVFLLVGLILYVGGGAVYFGSYYRANSRGMSFMESDDDVKISEIDKGYFFDGPGDKEAFIFYPGAKVDPKAYSAILHNLAAGGVDCFLVRMPLNMAMLGKDTAGEIMNSYSYDEWYLGGHSLGGAMASIYAFEHGDDLDGMVLMASYTPRDLKDDMKLILLAGDKDKVLNWETYKANVGNWPKDSTEYIIKGGNHAGFGDYGVQSGDGEATISNEEQQDQSVEEILKMIDVGNK